MLFRRYPIRSPITSAAKSPSEQASHTTTAELSPSLAPNVIAVSCVLSPSSATKNVQNTDSGANLILRSLTFSSSSSSPFSVVTAKNRNAAPAIRRMKQKNCCMWFAHVLKKISIFFRNRGVLRKRDGNFRLQKKLNQLHICMMI